MALFKILNNFSSGTDIANLTGHVQGYCYFDKNTNKFYIDTTNAAGGLRQLNGTYYGVCGTAANEANKAVIIPGFALVEGACVYIKFSYTNTADLSVLTLNVNSTGPKNIKYYGITNLNKNGDIKADSVCQFVYDGTNWLWVGHLDTNTEYIFADDYDPVGNPGATVETVNNALENWQVTYATTSSFASTANYSSTAGLATTANRAGTAGYATTASQATHAATANSATTASEATHAATANTATTAGFATTASQAVHAATAGSATTANEAIHAATANSATTASNASTAGWAISANYATTAGNATDTTKVAKAGDTMTGALILSGAPTQDLQAATKKYVDDAITSFSGPMRFIGTLGTGGTTSSLGDATTDNKGYSYKVIAAGTYQGVSCDIGDLIVSNGTTWINIPSGDEPDGTVTNIATGDGLTGGPITTTGTISHAVPSGASSGAKGGSASSRTYIQTITTDGFGHVTAVTTATESVVDTKVTQAKDTTSNTAYPIILAYGTSTDAVTNTVNKSANLTYNPSTKILNASGGTITATTLNGFLNGIAATAQEAIHAATANSATTASNATTAGFATTASQAVHAATANSATTASQATHAATANTAATAGFATTASEAVHATTANSATTASEATHAATANTAATASFATTASQATHAATANSATTANEAIHAATANSATTASEATHAATADTATTAGFATTASQATHAATANSATTAGFATTAAYTATAGFATTASEATHASETDLATTANNAITAGYATTASNADYADYSNLNGVEYIVGTQTTATGAWKGVTTSPSIYTGKTIAYKLPYAGSGSATLALTLPDGTTASAAVYLNNSRVTTHYAAGAVILMTYDGTNWRSTDYWNSNSRDAGYGSIALTQSTAETGITANTTTVAAKTYNEKITLTAGNKWVEFAGTNSSSNNADVLTVAHSISSATAGDYGDNSNQAPAYGETFNVPYISIDAAGHITDISSHTVKIPDAVTEVLHAMTANSATTASYSGTAGFATTASRATTAAYATTAGNATTASEATHAATANSATTASQATHAATANSATTANEATHAATANTATTAGFATTASRASTAAYATTAGNATDATKVAKSGDTMTGLLTLSGAPTSDLHAATKKYVDDSLSSMAGPMRFMGTLGTGGTTTTLAVAASTNKGNSYKVITNGTYQGVEAKVGDLLVSNGTTWVLIPSGDEPNGTVTNIATGSGLTGGPITTTGTISHAVPSGASSGSKGSTGRTYIQTITTDSFGHVTAVTTATESVTNTDTKVTQAADSTANVAYPVILAYDTSTSAVTNTVNKTNNFTYNPSTKTLTVTSGQVTATTFSGYLNGTATTATQATHAATANSATTATEATHAATANSATTASQATHAATANSATTASYAGTAGFATTASQATHAATANSATTASYSGTAGFATTASRATTAGNATDATKVPLAGGTMTGTLAIKNSEPVVVLYNTNADTNARMTLTYTATGNQGIWSSGYYDGTTYTADGKWIVYRGTDGNVILNGNANTATTAGNATTASQATHAATANSATTASNATTAGYATTASQATHAATANSATTASQATHAATANSATTANEATHAATANTATTAGFATTASQATHAATANSATTASQATHAATANSATTATNAVKVTQTNQTGSNDYRILLSGSANDTTETSGINKNTNLRFNPGTQTLSVGGSIAATGDLDVTGNTTLSGQTTADSLTAGSLLINGAANFVQIPTAPTPAATSNDTSVATTAFVMNAFTSNDAMVFKGVVNANSDLPATHYQGWTYRVGTAGTYANKVCEVGDIIICVTDGTAANNDHWAVIQNNVDGAVYRGANAFTDANIIIADSTAGKVKSSGKTISTATATSSSTDSTVPTTKAVWSTIAALDGTISGTAGAGKTLTAFSQTDGKVSATFGDISITKSQISDFPSTMTPSSHTHGNITNDGKIGSTADYAVYTTTDGAVTAGSLTTTDPTASGTSTTFIKTISQDSKGKITATKANLPTATTSTAGIWAMSSTNANTLISQLPTWTATPTDDTYLIRRDTGGGASYGQVKFSTVYGYIKTKLNVTNNNINLSRNTETTIATIGGTAIKIKLPASDNTDTKQNIILATTSKAFLTGVTTTPTSTAQALTGVADTGVYLTATAGEVSAVRHSFNVSGTEKAYMNYNSTTNAIDFIFV